MIGSLRLRKEWKFFGVLPKADRGLAAAWWTALVLRGVLPALFAIAMGVLVGAVQRGEDLVGPLAMLADRVRAAAGAAADPPGRRRQSWAAGPRPGSTTGSPIACVRPPGMGHLEDPKLTSDLTMARDFDLGITGPPIFISMDFIAIGLVEMIAGLASAAGARGLCVVGAARARRRVAGHALAACAKAPSGATATPRKSAARSAMPTTPTGSRSIRRPPRSCGCSGWRPGPSIASRSAAAGSSSFSGRPPGCASGPWPGACCWWSPPISWSSGALADRRRERHAGARSRGDLRHRRHHHQHDRLRRPVVGARRRRRARRRRCCASRRRWPPPVAARRGVAAGRRHARPRGPLPQRHLRLPDRRRAGARRLRSHDPRRLVARHRRPERRRQDHARQAALPPVRPAGRRDRDRRRRPARARSRRLAVARDGRLPGLHPLRAAASRQRGAGRCPRRCDPRGAGRCRRRGSRRTRHDPGARLRRRHRPLRRPVAARGAGPRALRRAAGRRASCCSTSPPRSSTCAARPRSSIASSPPPGTPPRS